MNEVTNWTFGETEVRTIEKDGEPWWVLSDVCKVLELNSPHKVADRLEEDEKGRNLIPTLGGEQEMTIINESGLYSVILRSDKPQAKPFRKWVTAEVLPSIRKNGCYSKQEISPMLQYLIQMEQKQNALEAKQKELEQKLDFNRKEVIEAALAYGCIGSFHQSEVQKTVRLKAIEECRTAQAFDTVGKSVINAIYKALQQYFGIPSYKDLRINQMAEARAFILDWMPSPELREKIAKATPKPKFNLMDLL